MAQKTCFVFGGGEASLLAPSVCPGDLVLAADSGLDYALALGLSVDLAVGDFDSLNREPDCEGMEVVRLPAEKDVTDMAAACQIAYGRGYRTFRLYGSCGGRLDHTLANIALAVSLTRQGAACSLHAKDSLIEVLSDGIARYPKESAGLVSIFSYTDVSEGVTLTNLKYPLQDAALTSDVALGVSNEFIVGKEASVSVRKGTLTIVRECR